MEYSCDFMDFSIVWTIDSYSTDNFIWSPPWIKIIICSNLHPTCMKMIKMTAMHLSINSFLFLTAYPTSFSGLIPADAGWELGAPRAIHHWAKTKCCLWTELEETHTSDVTTVFFFWWLFLEEFKAFFLNLFINSIPVDPNLVWELQTLGRICPSSLAVRPSFVQLSCKYTH